MKIELVRRRFKKDCFVPDQKEVDLQFGELAIVALFRFLRFGNQLANAAGVFSIEGFQDSDSNGVRLGEADEHADPGAGLQDDPMSADREDQQECDNQVVQPQLHSVGKVTEEGR